jgi:CRP/FNR family transcriptional regulator, cyclic AMP receptor protein
MSGFDWMDALESSVKVEILRHASKRIFAKETMIQEGGDVATHVHQIVTGRVRQFLLDENGNQILLHVYENGDVLGDSLGLGGLAYPLWLCTASRVTLRSWSGTCFAQLRTEHNAVEAAVAAQTDRRFRMAITLLTEMATLDAFGRVAGRLCHLAKFAASRDALHLGCSQDDLAMMANVSRQTANKVMAHLTDEGMVQGCYGRIFIKDVDALKRYRNTRRRRPGS